MPGPALVRQAPIPGERHPFDPGMLALGLVRAVTAVLAER